MEEAGKGIKGGREEGRVVVVVWCLACMRVRLVRACREKASELKQEKACEGEGMGTGDGERAGSQAGSAGRSSAGGGTLGMGEQADGGAGGWRRRPLCAVCRDRGELRESSRGSVLRVAGRWQCLCRCGLLYRHRRGAELASEQGQRQVLSAQPANRRFSHFEQKSRTALANDNYSS